MTNPSPREAAKRNQILTTARRLFLSRGYAGTSMDLVTSEAGISKQTLYRYYSTKEALFADILNEVIRELTEEKQPELGHLPIPDNKNQLYDILLMMAQVITQKLTNPLYQSVLRMIFSEAARFPELADMFRKSIPRSTDIFLELMRRSNRRGLVKLTEEDMEISMSMFIGPLISHAVFYGLMEGERAPEPMPLASLEQLCRIYVDSIT